MSDLIAFLKDKHGIPEGKVVFYLQWISKYIKFSKNSSNYESRSIKRFGEELRQKYKEWQVEQTVEVVRLHAFQMFESSLLWYCRFPAAV